MNKKKLFEQFGKARERVAEIKAKIENEKRVMTQEETAEVQRLISDMELLRAQIASLDGPGVPVAQARTLEQAAEVWDTCYRNRTPMRVVVTRSTMTSAAHNTLTANDDGLIPITEKEFIKPLREGLIWNTVGINIQHGLKGKLRWPTHTKAVASWEDEITRLPDSTIDFGKLTMEGSRLGIAIPVSRVELDDTQGRVESVIREEMPKAIIDAINEAVFTLKGEHIVVQGTAKTWKAKRQVGPFAFTLNTAGSAIVNPATCQVKTLAANTPTRKELLEMQANVYSKGLTRVAPGYVMNYATKVALQDTKVDAGSGRFVCENNMILGVPVFETSLLPDGVVLFGDFSYLAAGFFGETSVIVDPYTLAREFSVDFVLNQRFGMTVLRPEAFVLGITSAAKAAIETAMKTEFATAD